MACQLVSSSSQVVHFAFDPPADSSGDKFCSIFVTVDSYESAARCIKELTGATVLGCQITVKLVLKMTETLEEVR